MSLEGNGSYDVHEPDTVCNSKIKNVIGIVKGASSVSECINTLARGRLAHNVLEEKSNKRIGDRAEWAKMEEIGQAEIELER